MTRHAREVPLHERSGTYGLVRVPGAHVQADGAEVELAPADVSDGVPDAVLDDAELRRGVPPRAEHVPPRRTEHGGVHVRDERPVAAVPVRGRCGRVDVIGPPRL